MNFIYISVLRTFIYFIYLRARQHRATIKFNLIFIKYLIKSAVAIRPVKSLKLCFNSNIHFQSSIKAKNSIE